MIRTQLHHLLQDSAGSFGSRPALTYKDRTYNFRDLWRTVQSVARGLVMMGLERGDRVAVLLDKRIETVSSIFGSSAAGGVFVPINPLFRPPQVGYILGNCDVRILITSPERLAQLTEELGDRSSVEHVILVGDDRSSPGTNSLPGIQVHPWDDVFTDEPGEIGRDGIDLDVAAILYTSGSTGKPKGVVLSHRNLIVGAESVSQYLANTSDDVILSALPLSFDAGFSQLTTAFSVGAHVVLMNYLLPADVVKLCTQHGVTGLTCVPPLWIQIADLSWPTETAATLRYFANTGGRMPKSTLDKLRDHFPQAAPFLMYGLTEAFRSTYLDPAEVDRRPDSIGKAIPNAEILVVRPDGTECDAGEEGELVHRGALVAMGYWNDPERTAERFRPVPGRERDVGWRAPELAVWSGDGVTRDEDGFLYFVGRTDDMIKTSGYRVSPTEIEEVAFASGLVRDAVAFGVDDAKLGQRVLLVASPVAGQDLDIQELLRVMRRQLPLYMIPSKVVVRPELPRSPNGKFDRVRLREEIGQ